MKEASLEVHMTQVSDPSYKNHPIFNELSGYIKYYESLAHSIFSYIPFGIKAVGNMDSYVISSIQGTIESIKTILLDGKIGDAYSLTRKYHDAVVTNIYIVQYLKEKFSIDNYVVQKIDSWRSGKEKLPRYDEMMDLIEKAPQLQKINQILSSNNHYQDMRQRCNDYAHFNSLAFMLANDDKIYIKNRIKILNELSGDIRSIFIEHFVWLFTLNEHYMASSDYIDSLECGMNPEEGSQYYVAPFIHETYDNIIKKYRVDLAVEFKSSTSMKLI